MLSYGVLHKLIRHCAGAGDLARAQAWFDRCAAALAGTGLEPSLETRALMENFRHAPGGAELSQTRRIASKADEDE